MRKVLFQVNTVTISLYDITNYVLFKFQLERESLDQDSHLFTAELNCIIINVLFHLFFFSSRLAHTGQYIMNSF